MYAIRDARCARPRAAAAFVDAPRDCSERATTRRRDQYRGGGGCTPGGGSGGAARGGAPAPL
ncbi:hypothetical protein C6T58_03020 [Burkholderia multivorans]|nr:hypothetical protein C6Q11_17090 [Burkholderia multivorans]PRG85043.1 hypothetical protein C6T58_03020 [Burkholderia multivorans]